MVKKLLNGKLFMSPVGSHPQRILDLGCGSGQWALEGETSCWQTCLFRVLANTPWNLCLVADEYPSARVLGVDLAPIGPYMHPENVEFKIDDIEAEWPPAYRESDLIHARCVIPTLKDPRKLLASVLRSVADSPVRCLSFVRPNNVTSTAISVLAAGSSSERYIRTSNATMAPSHRRMLFKIFSVYMQASSPIGTIGTFTCPSACRPSSKQPALSTSRFTAKGYPSGPGCTRRECARSVSGPNPFSNTSSKMCFYSGAIWTSAKSRQGP